MLTYYEKVQQFVTKLRQSQHCHPFTRERTAAAETAATQGQLLLLLLLSLLLLLEFSLLSFSWEIFAYPGI